MELRVTPYVDDRDFTLYVGDVREVVAGLPDGSVDCVVTSPPYFGLRDYGTGQWAGGNPDCDHEPTGTTRTPWANSRPGPAGADGKNAYSRNETKEVGGVCGRCGASRVDRQIGLEATPELFVQQMVEVFREVRRVLAAHGTCWVNLGDSYVANAASAERPHGFKRREGISDGTDAPAMAVNAIGGRKAGLKSKDLVGIPWRVAFALQQDGWWLRSDIVWAKPNPMPESVTDRPTKSHEYVFLLTKQPRYWFDQEAVREPHTPDGRAVTTRTVSNGSHANYQEFGHEEGRERWPNGGRNVRSVWEIATQPYPEAHFATFPEALPDRCIRAGCPERVCRTCGKPSERIVETNNPSKHAADPDNTLGWANTHSKTSNAQSSKSLHRQPGGVYSTAQTVGWSDCGHNTWRTGVVLDPFMGSGTTALVARRLGRCSIGIELNEEYAALCARRLQQLSLFAEEAV